MTLAQLWALAKEIFAIVLTILQLTKRVDATGAKEITPYAIQANTADILLTVRHPTWGNQALYNLIQANTTDQQTRFNRITGPAPTYGTTFAPSASSALVTAIWNYLSLNATPNTVSMDQLLAWAGQFAANLGTQGAFRMWWNPWFTFENALSDKWDAWAVYQAVTPDWSDMRATDTVGTWLNRTETQYGPNWVYAPDSDTWRAYFPNNISPTHTIRCLMHQSDFNAIRDGYANKPPNLPPVWPGLANVTLGAPVALAAVVDIVTPMDGVLVVLSSNPSGRTEWLVGNQPHWFNLGQIGFEQDNGQVEPFQWLGFSSAVYLPRQMTRAAAVHLRVLGGPSGTVTPFTVVP